VSDVCLHAVLAQLDVLRNFHHVMVGCPCRGGISCLKLSPNLRKVALTPDGKPSAALDAARLDAIFDVALKSDFPRQEP
jgi:hypothetical protein